LLVFGLLMWCLIASGCDMTLCLRLYMCSFAGSLCGPWAQKVLASDYTIILFDWR
jgi:hypothetical protein